MNNIKANAPDASLPDPEPIRFSINISHLNKSFAGMPVLSDVNLQVPSGQFICLLGASGCGKSTLLRTVAALETADQGTIQFVGEPIGKSASIPAGLMPRLAFVFQQANLLPWRTVAGNIALPLELQGVKPSELRRQVQQRLVEVGLRAEDAQKYPRMLSGGMQMRASLARALVTQPHIMLLDEPFAALDEILRQRLCEELLAWHRQHRWTTLFVTHNVAEAVFLADRIIILRSVRDLPSTTSGVFQSTIASEHEIRFPRRDVSLRESPEYLEKVAALSRRFREIADPRSLKSDAPTSENDAT